MQGASQSSQMSENHLFLSGLSRVSHHTGSYLKRAHAGAVRWRRLPVRESMECMVRHAVSGDEAQKTPEHRGNRPHLTAAEETPIPETARAIAFKLGKPPTLPNLSFLFYFISSRSSLFFAVPQIFYVGLYFRHVDFLITLGHLNSHNIKTTDS